MLLQRVLKIYLIGLATFSLFQGESFSSEFELESPSKIAATNKDELRYRLLQSQDSERIRISIQGIPAPSPNHLILKIKRKNEILGRMNVHLTEYSPENSVYTGILPANILITGGITFELTH